MNGNKRLLFLAMTMTATACVATVAPPPSVAYGPPSAAGPYAYTGDSYYTSDEGSVYGPVYGRAYGPSVDLQLDGGHGGWRH
jgi:hypothetical protein